MRQVFASARLENVEAVAGLLRAEGIEVKISDGRSYRGNRRGTFRFLPVFFTAISRARRRREEMDR